MAASRRTWPRPSSSSSLRWRPSQSFIDAVSFTIVPALSYFAIHGSVGRKYKARSRQAAGASCEVLRDPFPALCAGQLRALRRQGGRARRRCDHPRSRGCGGAVGEGRGAQQAQPRRCRRSARTARPCSCGSTPKPERLRADAEAAVKAGAFGLFVPKSRDPQGAAATRPMARAAGDRPQAHRAGADDRGPGRGARCARHRECDAARIRPGHRRRGSGDRAQRRADAGGADAAEAAGALRRQGRRRAVAGACCAPSPTTATSPASSSRRKEARAHGIDGATCVHPAVVPILNKAFSASAEELDHARRLVEAYEQGARRQVSAQSSSKAR